ncbi:MAG TPA: hypothetical protein PLY35_08400 [Thermotogota bacterium]|nr:hypothetical protein [Thermotogota bacterium]
MKLKNIIIQEDIFSFLRESGSYIQNLILFWSILYALDISLQTLWGYIKKNYPSFRKFFTMSAHDRKVESMVARLMKDPEVVKRAQAKHITGWKEFLKTKITPEEHKYIKSIYKSYFAYVNMKKS